jgi:predicted AAA+ superfamily ATPase
MNILAQTASGTQFENAVYNQLRHYGELRYYALKTGQEIDFVLDEKMALEVKETPTQMDAQVLHSLSKTIGLKKHILIGRFPSPRFNDHVWGGEIK